MYEAYVNAWAVVLPALEALVLTSRFSIVFKLAEVLCWFPRENFSRSQRWSLLIHRSIRRSVVFLFCCVSFFFFCHRLETVVLE